MFAYTIFLAAAGLGIWMAKNNGVVSAPRTDVFGVSTDCGHGRSQATILSSA